MSCLQFVTERGTLEAKRRQSMKGDTPIAKVVVIRPYY